MKINMASWSAIETCPGFETVSKQRLAHTRYRLSTISAESFPSRRVEKGSAGRVHCRQFLQPNNQLPASLKLYPVSKTSEKSVGNLITYCLSC